MLFEKVIPKALDWAFQRKAKTAFRNPLSRSKYQPKSNTPLFYDGSAEAQAILSADVECTTEGNGVRRHALDYLKGKDVEHMGMWTLEIMEPLDELEKLAISQMVMDRSAVVESEEPKQELVQIEPPTTA